MAENKPLVVYAAAYDTVEAALTDLDDIEQLHKDEMIGQYDAAVIDKENGKPHMVKRMDRPHIRVIPEWFGGGTLPRRELNEAAEQLTELLAGTGLAAGPGCPRKRVPAWRTAALPIGLTAAWPIRQRAGVKGRFA